MQYFLSTVKAVPALNRPSASIAGSATPAASPAGDSSSPCCFASSAVPSRCANLRRPGGQPRQAAASGLVRRSAALDAGLRQPATPLADLRNRLSAAAGEVPRRGAGPQVPFQKQAAESGRQRHRPVRLAVRLGPVPAHQTPSNCIWCSTTTAICPASASSPTARRPTWRRPARCCSTPARSWSSTALQRLRLVRRAERAGRFLCHAIEARGRLEVANSARCRAAPQACAATK